MVEPEVESENKRDVEVDSENEYKLGYAIKYYIGLEIDEFIKEFQHHKEKNGDIWTRKRKERLHIFYIIFKLLKYEP